MAYMFMVGQCINCFEVITFNPNYVPSIRHPDTGKREPLCPTCHAKWNEIHRTSKGLPPVEAHWLAWEPEEVA
jgi:hypothetical protein